MCTWYLNGALHPLLTWLQNLWDFICFMHAQFHGSKTEDKTAVSSKELLVFFVFSLRLETTNVTWKLLLPLFCKYNFSVLLGSCCFSHSRLLGRHKEKHFQLIRSTRLQMFNELLFPLSQWSNCNKVPTWMRCFLAVYLLNCTSQPSFALWKNFDCLVVPWSLPQLSRVNT